MSAKKPKPKSLALRRIGLWATIWWGVSGLYVVLLVWLARNKYAMLSVQLDSSGFFANWWSAICDIYRGSSLLTVLFRLIVIVWLVGGYLWLRTLKRQNISYKAAFKDLFLTIR